MKAAEVMEYIGISRSALYKLIDKGVLNPVRIGRIMRFDRTDIDQTLINNKAIQ